MANVEIYLRPTCPYSRRAWALLEERGAPLTVYDINEAPEKRDEMIERSNGRTTVPEIFIDGKHIGGCDDLLALDESGDLDRLLEA